MSALAEPVTFETDRWRLSLPVGWRHEPTNDEEGFSVASEDGEDIRADTSAEARFAT